MFSSGVRTFTDPDEYTASIVGTRCELTITGRGDFEARIITVNLPRLWVQRLSDNLPRTAYCVGAAADRDTITFRTQPGPSLRRSGIEMLPSNLIRRGRGGSYHQRSEGLAGHGAMSLPFEDMVSIGEAMAGCDVSPPTDARSITPSPMAMGRLQELHAAAGHLAEHAPAVIAVPEAAHGLEQALIGAVVNCFGKGDAEEDRSAARQHAGIMRRFRRITEENLDRALFIPEVCLAIGASERTLRVCCHEHLGVGPKRYLLLRRMHLARRALRNRTSPTETVTDIAMQHGFWELGRFAVEYKELFGESPSATLSGGRMPHLHTGDLRDPCLADVAGTHANAF